MFDSSSQNGGKSVSKPALIIFIVQLSLILIASCVSMVNLSLGTGNKILWTMLLSSSLGYVMPNPKIKYVDNGDKGMSNRKP